MPAPADVKRGCFHLRWAHLSIHNGRRAHALALRRRTHRCNAQRHGRTTDGVLARSLQLGRGYRGAQSDGRSRVVRSLGRSSDVARNTCRNEPDWSDCTSGAVMNTHTHTEHASRLTPRPRRFSPSLPPRPPGSPRRSRSGSPAPPSPSVADDFFARRAAAEPFSCGVCASS